MSSGNQTIVELTISKFDVAEYRPRVSVIKTLEGLTLEYLRQAVHSRGTPLVVDRLLAANFRRTVEQDEQAPVRA